MVPVDHKLLQIRQKVFDIELCVTYCVLLFSLHVVVQSNFLTIDPTIFTKLKIFLQSIHPRRSNQNDHVLFQRAINHRRIPHWNVSHEFHWFLWTTTHRGYGKECSTLNYVSLTACWRFVCTFVCNRIFWQWIPQFLQNPKYFYNLFLPSRSNK